MLNIIMSTHWILWTTYDLFDISYYSMLRMPNILPIERNVCIFKLIFLLYSNVVLSQIK